MATYQMNHGRDWGHSLAADCLGNRCWYLGVGVAAGQAGSPSQLMMVSSDEKGLVKTTAARLGEALEPLKRPET